MGNKAVLSKLVVLCHGFLDLRYVFNFQTAYSWPMSGSQDHSIWILQSTFLVFLPSAAGDSLRILLPKIVVNFHLPWGTVIWNTVTYIWKDRWDDLKYYCTALQLSHPVKLPYSEYCNFMQIVSSVFIKFVVKALGRLTKLAIMGLSPAPLLLIIGQVLDLSRD